MQHSNSPHNQGVSTAPARSVYIFIDAENIDSVYAAQIFNLAKQYGTISVKEIYGAGIALNEWAEPIMEYAIHTNITLKPNRFKNSSDICLVIGVMRTMTNVLMERDDADEQTHYSFTEDGDASDAASDTAPVMIIASSDSDFSPLAVQLRNEGFRVIGIGEAESSNQLWMRACDEFVALDAATIEANQSKRKRYRVLQGGKDSDPGSGKSSGRAERAQNVVVYLN